MKRHFVFVLGALAALQLGSEVFGADLSEIGRTLPPICKSGMSMDMGQSNLSAVNMGPTDAAHQDLMKGMAEMDANMNEGMMAPDFEVAFVCGMIPHHQGAIDMAKAELAHGKDPFVRKLAEQIMTEQEQQIAAMLDWLKKQKRE